jgi:hypothetical protein
VVKRRERGVRARAAEYEGMGEEDMIGNREIVLVVVMVVVVVVNGLAARSKCRP